MAFEVNYEGLNRNIMNDEIHGSQECAGDTLLRNAKLSRHPSKPEYLTYENRWLRLCEKSAKHGKCDFSSGLK